MSGHSKWASIKHQKGAADAKRGKVFTKLGHAVTVAARAGGDPSMNARLALAVEMAKKSNMPKENIDRAIKRGTGEAGGAAAEEVTYEAYGPGGTAVMIEAITDNKNRTISEIRALLNKYNGKLGESGSVAYLFKQQGVITLVKDKPSDEMELAIIDSGAEDYEETEGNYLVYTDPKQLSSAKEALESAGLNINEAEIRFEPTQTLAISDEKTAGQIIKLMEALEELDDVANLVGNFDIPDELLGKINQ